MSSGQQEVERADVTDMKHYTIANDLERRSRKLPAACCPLPAEPEAYDE
jgi:hypothetical protein